MMYVKFLLCKLFSSPLIIALCLTAFVTVGCATGYSQNPDSDYIADQKLRTKALSKSLAWSPDGKWLATAGTRSLVAKGPDQNDTVRVWNTTTGRLKWSLQAHVGERSGGRVFGMATSVAWSPDGKYLATSGAETIRIWNVSTRLDEQVLRVTDGKEHSPLEMAWSHDGKYIASGSNNGEIVIWKVGSGERVFVLKGHSAVISSVAWSPDGKRLASSSYDKTVRVWDTVTGKEVHEFKGHTGNVQAVVWSPDGKKLASGGNDSTVRFWDVESGRQEQSIGANVKPGGPQSPFPGIVFSLSWNIDGSSVAFSGADGTVQLIDVGTKNIKDILLGHYGEVLSVRWSPDGIRLASCDFNGTIIIWKEK